MASRDYEEFIAALNARGVRYLLVGAHAVALHARPRATQDLDVLVEPTRTNARRLIQALRDFFGGADLGYSVEEVIDPSWIIQLGVAPVRIGLMSEIPGIDSFPAAWKRRVDAPFGGEPAHFIGLEQLMDAKRASGRLRDRADLEDLERAGPPVRTARVAKGRSPRRGRRPRP